MTHIDFLSSPRPTIGVEMELELIDRDSRELVKGAHEILTEMGEPHGERGIPRRRRSCSSRPSRSSPGSATPRVAR